MDEQELYSIRERLLYEMKRGAYAQAEKLPAEAVLAVSLGISRTQLRDSLASLEREGFIVRRQGIGTVINRQVLAVTTRMDLEKEFLDMVAETGAKPGIAFVEVDTVFADEEMSKRLLVSANTPVIRVSRAITADDRTAIYCIDYVSFHVVKKYTYHKEDLEKPIFYFLEKFCDISVYMDLTVVRPMVADRRLGELFGIEAGSPILYMDEVGYDIDSRPVLWSKEYYADGIFEHTVLRKKI